MGRTDDDRRLLAILGIRDHKAVLLRTLKTEKAIASWFPLLGDMAVLMSAPNHRNVKERPMSFALEEEYRIDSERMKAPPWNPASGPPNFRCVLTPKKTPK